MSVHVGDLALHELERSDRLAKLFALMDIGESVLRTRTHASEHVVGADTSAGAERERTTYVKGRLHETERATGENDALDCPEHPTDMVESAAVCD